MSRVDLEKRAGLTWEAFELVFHLSLYLCPPKMGIRITLIKFDPNFF